MNSDSIFTIAFYNLENLFDIVDDPDTFDDDFTPKGKLKWTGKRYKRKLNKMSNVISRLGNGTKKGPPDFIGIVEVENEQVVSDLIHSKYLKSHPYDFVHYESPDERGIDVALLYNKQVFELLESETFPILLNNENGLRDYTRDILLVKGNLKGKPLHILVNHWPSRRGGPEETEPKRIKAAQVGSHIIDRIFTENEDPNIIIMGDFNDGPKSKSVKDYLLDSRFFNPMEHLAGNGQGSLNHDGDWYLFDQIIFTRNFCENTTDGFRFRHADIFDKHFLQEWHGKYKGNPFRTYVGKRYLGGFSDHFPVYIQIEKE